MESFGFGKWNLRVFVSGLVALTASTATVSADDSDAKRADVYGKDSVYFFRFVREAGTEGDRWSLADSKRTEMKTTRAAKEIPAARNRSPASYRPKARKKSSTEPQKTEGVTEPAVATVPSDAVPSGSEEDFGFSGGWGGGRSRLASLGVSAGLVYKADWVRAASGGNERKTMYLQNLDVRLLVDVEKLAGFRGLQIYASGTGDWGADRGQKPSGAVGDAQGTSNIETSTDSFRLYEAWAQQNFSDDKVSFLVGIHDLNSEFYVTDSSTLLLNSSFGVGKEFSQSGSGGPSIFPYPTTAARLKVSPAPDFTLQSGAFNAVATDSSRPDQAHYSFSGSDGVLFVTEADYLTGGDRPAKYGVGYWTYSRTFDSLSENVTDAGGGTQSKQVPSSGVYFLWDRAWSRAFSTFARYGIANSLALSVKNDLSVGTLIRGPISARPSDKLGFGITRASTPGSAENAETTYEGSYRAELGRGFALQPDLQFVHRPNFGSSTADALVSTLRVEISF